MPSKKSFISLIILAVISLVSLDFWHPKLDQSRSLTKVFDLLYLPWLSISGPLPHYQFMANNFVVGRQSYPVKAKFADNQWQFTFTDQDFQGYRQLVFIAPETVNFFADDLALYRARALGLVTRDRWFASLKINHQPARVFLVLEAWNKDVLEKNRRSSDSDLFAPIDYQTWGKLAVNPLAPQDYSALDRLLRADQDELARLVDLDSLIRWQAYLQLSRRSPSEPFLLFFNRDLGQFEFIPNPQPSVSVIDTSLVSRLASLEPVKAEVEQFVTASLKDQQNSHNEIKFYRQLWLDTRFAFAQDLLKPYSTLFFTVKAWQGRPQI